MRRPIAPTNVLTNTYSPPQKEHEMSNNKHGQVKVEMSFFSGALGGNVVALDKDALKEAVQSAPSIDYTHGFRYRRPTTLDVAKTAEEAIEIIEEHSLLDARIYEDGHVSLNTYSANDMF